MTSDPRGAGDRPDEVTGPDPADPDPADHDDPVEGQVLGRSVPLSEEVTRAEPGSPETGARRDPSGRPIAE